MVETRIKVIKKQTTLQAFISANLQGKKSVQRESFIMGAAIFSIGPRWDVLGDLLGDKGFFPIYIECLVKKHEFNFQHCFMLVYSCYVDGGLVPVEKLAEFWCPFLGS